MITIYSIRTLLINEKLGVGFKNVASLPFRNLDFCSERQQSPPFSIGLGRFGAQFQRVLKLKPVSPSRALEAYIQIVKFGKIKMKDVVNRPCNLLSSMSEK